MFFLGSYPAEGMVRIPMIAVSIFAIWGTPVLFDMINREFHKNMEFDSGMLRYEKRSFPALFERAVIFVAIIMGNLYYLFVILPFIVRGISMRLKSDLGIPYINWIIVALIAVIMKVLVVA